MRVFVFLLFISRVAISQDINEVRQLYLSAGIDRLQTPLFIDYFSKVESDSSVLFLAYYGTAITMKADLEKGKINKYRVFTEGRDILESAIDKNRKSVEMRYLRFAVQSNIPRILGYNDLDEDKKFLLSNLQAIQHINNKELQEVIYSTLLSISDISENEKQKLRLELNKINTKN